MSDNALSSVLSDVAPTVNADELSRRNCWVCFATDEDDRTAEWSRPCRCKGTTKWVHHTCLQRWIDEKQKGNSLTKVSCPQCNTEYLIIFPQLGSFLYILDLTDRVIYKVCPFLAGGIVLGSLYWSAVTYGAVTVMQVLGHKEGLASMEQADPLFLLIGLPTIPVMLILGKMCRWEEYVLRFWRRHSAKIPLLQYLFPGSNSEYEGGSVRDVGGQDALFANPLSATRVLCGALILPTIATFCGKMIYSNVHSNLQRTILGGITFVAIKGALKVYYKQQQYIRQSQRRILDYDDKAAAAAAVAAAALQQQKADTRGQNASIDAESAEIDDEYTDDYDNSDDLDDDDYSDDDECHDALPPDIRHI